MPKTSFLITALALWWLWLYRTRRGFPGLDSSGVPPAAGPVDLSHPWTPPIAPSPGAVPVPVLPPFSTNLPGPGGVLQ